MELARRRLDGDELLGANSRRLTATGRLRGNEKGHQGSSRVAF